jgi:diguanylate cyclase (GGDEF)-like protein
MLAFAPLIFYAPGWRLQIKFLFTAVLCLFYLVLALYTQEYGPRIQATVHQTKIMLSSNIVTMFLVTSAMAFFYRMASLNAEKELQFTNEKLKDLATTDSLTGLLNRRTMIEMIENESSRFNRTLATFALILGAIDDFKVVNDLHGHEAGDRVLVEISHLLRQSLRTHDKVARWGGEEFLVLLPETDLEAAGHVAEQLRVSIELNLATSGKAFVPVTIIYGVNEYTNGAEISECIRLADKALYEGKVQGKNRVVMAPGYPENQQPVVKTAGNP